VEAGGGDGGGGEGGGGEGTWPQGVHFTSSFELVVRFLWSVTKSPKDLVTLRDSNIIMKQHIEVVVWSVTIFFLEFVTKNENDENLKMKWCTIIMLLSKQVCESGKFYIKKSERVCVAIWCVCEVWCETTYSYLLKLHYTMSFYQCTHCFIFINKIYLHFIL